MDILSITNKESVSADSKVYTKDGSDFVTTTFDALYKNSSAKTNIEQSVSDANARIDTTNNTVAELDNYARGKANGIVLQSQGEMVTVNDSSDDYVVNLKAYGKSEQDSTTGAQLLPNMHVGYTNSSAGMTCEVTDKGCMVNGTPTGTYLSVIAGELELSEGTYYVSGSNASGSLYTQVTVVRNGTTTHYVNKSFAIYGDETSVTYRIQNGGTTPTFTNEIIQPMLNAGSTALPWEPYTGGKPSPNPDYPQEIRSSVISEIKTIGKNWLKNTATSQTSKGITFTVNKDKSITVNGISTDRAQLDLGTNVLPAGSYILSQGHAINYSVCIFASYKVNGESKYIDLDSAVGGERSFTLDSETSVSFKADVRESNRNISNITLYPMIRKAEITDPTYEPYTETVAQLSEPITLYGIATTSGGNFTDSNGQQWIADYIDTARGKVVRNVESLVATTVYGSYLNGNKDCLIGRLTDNAKPYNTKIVAPIMCNCLPIVTGDTQYTSNISLLSSVNGHLLLTIKDITNESDMNAWLAEHETIVHYPLATPTEEDLPTADVVALRNLKTFYSVTNVTNDSEVKGEMVLSYNADTKMYIDNKFAELAAQLV